MASSHISGKDLENGTAWLFRRGGLFDSNGGHSPPINSFAENRSSYYPSNGLSSSGHFSDNDDNTISLSTSGTVYKTQTYSSNPIQPKH